jgi:hypothetical protein
MHLGPSFNTRCYSVRTVAPELVKQPPTPQPPMEAGIVRLATPQPPMEAGIVRLATQQPPTQAVQGTREVMITHDDPDKVFSKLVKQPPMQAVKGTREAMITYDDPDKVFSKLSNIEGDDLSGASTPVKLGQSGSGSHSQNKKTSEYGEDAYTSTLNNSLVQTTHQPRVLETKHIGTSQIGGDETALQSSGCFNPVLHNPFTNGTPRVLPTRLIGTYQFGGDATATPLFNQQPLEKLDGQQTSSNSWNNPKNSALNYWVHGQPSCMPNNDARKKCYSGHRPFFDIASQVDVHPPRANVVESQWV